jgi:hypothetical protein
VFLLIFAFLPLVNWIPASQEAPWYHGLAGEWANGTAIVIGAAAVLTILSRRFPSLWPETWLAGPRVSSLATSPATLAVIVGLAFALYAGTARVVFDAHPLVIDEIVQTFQAQILAGGRLWLPVSPHPEFVSELNIIDWGGKMYSHFPVGGPAMLALGELIHAPWLVNPLAGALSVLLFAAMASTIEPGRRTRLAATVLFAFAPFTTFMAGSYMNHVTALTWLLLGLAGLAKVTATDAPRPWWAFACGLGFGCSAAIRPIDAVIFALPAGLWLFVRAGKRHMRVRDLVAAALGLALPLAALMWVNLETTGAPLRFGYQVMWGGNVGLGFHPSPWGVPHTPLRGLVLLNLYFIRLQTFLYETPLPSLVPVVAALALTRRISPFDRYLLGASALLVAAYFAYWHDGYYLGPRFMYPLLPVLALWTARLPRIVAERFGSAEARRAVIFAYLVSVALALGLALPIRARQYHSMFGLMRWDVSEAAAAAGVRNAVVFVRETWGAQLLVRMWALGVSRADAERIYNRVDACVLDHVTSDLQGTPGHRPSPDAVLGALNAAMADSGRLVRSSFSPDTSERFLPGHRYTQGCVDRINEDRGGTMLLAPLLLARDGNVYVRDLHERNAVLAREYPNRPLFLLRPPSAHADVAPQFYLLSRDSVLTAGQRLVAEHD